MCGRGRCPRAAIGAASVSVSRLESGAGVVRTLLNAGELGPCEESCPEDETYSIDDFAGLGLFTEGTVSWTTSLDEPDGDLREIELLCELGKFTVLVVGHDPADVVAVADGLCGLTWNLGTPATLSCGAASVMVGDGETLNPRELFAAGRSTSPALPA